MLLRMTMMSEPKTIAPAASTALLIVEQVATSAVGEQNEAKGAAVDRELRIRDMAYMFFVERGCVPGQELDDWLRAEACFEQAERQASH
jgi:hypothetical protein